MDVKHLLFIILGAVFVNNYVLQRFLGICPFLGVSKKLDQASGMSIAVVLNAPKNSAQVRSVILPVQKPDHRLHPGHRRPGAAR